MTSKRDCVLSVLNGDECATIPAAPLVGFHSAALFNVPIQSATSNGKTMADLQLKTAEFYNLDATFNFMDLTLEPEALGAGVSWKDLPSIGSPLSFHDAEKYLEIEGQEFINRGRLRINIESIKTMKESNKGIAIGGYLSGPITFLSQSFGVTSIFSESRKNLQRLKSLTSMASKMLQSYADELVSAGADTLMILEPVAALLSPKLFSEIGMASISELVRDTKSKGVAAILHVCGNSNHILDQMIKTKPSAVSIDSQVNIDTPLKIDPKIVVLGNIGTTELQRLSPKEISELTRAALEKTSGTRHILSSACDVPVHAPSENIRAMIEVSRTWQSH